MKHFKAVECDYCGDFQLSTLKKTLKSFLKNIKWFQIINSNGTTNEFCSKECFNNFKDDCYFNQNKQKCT
jgi:hypothetical protein